MAVTPDARVRVMRLLSRAPLTLLLALLSTSSLDAHAPRAGALSLWVLDAPPASTRRARVTYAASSPVAFYRASLALFAYDWTDPTLALSRSRFEPDDARPLGIGDAHVENFGTLLGRDGRVTLEPNDLDAARPVPYLWHLRRLTVSLCLAANASNPADARAKHAAINAARDIARDAALAYAHALTTHDAPPPRGAVLDALMTRAQTAIPLRNELTEFTEIRDGARRVRRGVTDRDEPDRALVELPTCAQRSLPALLRAWRATLTDPPPEVFFTPLDAALHLGRGGASAGRARAMILLRGPSDRPDDDVLVEIKDLSGLGQADPAAPMLVARAALWSRPDADPYWGTGVWFGRAVQIRTESDAARTLHISHLRGPLGTPAALRALARSLGAQLAEIHRRSLPSSAPQIARIAHDLRGFANEQAEVSLEYTNRVLSDWRLLRRLSRALPSAPPAVAETTVGCDPFATSAGPVLRSPTDGL